MAEGTADDRADDETTRPPSEADLGAAVDDALRDEVKRQKARFVQQIMGYDRYRDPAEGRTEDPAD